MKLATKRERKLYKAFRLYKEVRSTMEYYQRQRTSSFGILVHTDEHALKYQALHMRLEFLTAILENRPPNWHCARWLSVDEATNRNEISQQYDSK